MGTDREAARIRQVYDAYARSRSTRARWDEANPGNAAILAERSCGVARALERHGLVPLDAARVLEVGCGTGDVLAGLRALGARAENLDGVDLLPERVAEARRRYPEIRWRCGNAESLGFPDACFDLVVTFTVFSSILDQAMAQNLVHEIERVLRPGGALLWYDFRVGNPYNRHVRGMSLRRLRRLLPGWRLDLRSVTLLPPLARRLGPSTRILYPFLARVPLLRTHHVGLLHRGDAGGA